MLSRRFPLRMFALIIFIIVAAVVISVNITNVNASIPAITVGELVDYEFVRMFESGPTYTIPYGDMISGWEGDKSGGFWEKDKTQPYIEPFGFRLNDNSTSYPVTLKKKFAKQSSGVVACEFNFRQPTIMDGASWELLSGNTPIVIIRTGGNYIQYVNYAGAYANLQTYNANQFYGIKIVVDISNKKADIYIDGVLKASQIDFRYPVSSVDYFLVKTGEASTGTMNIDMCKIYKGYSIFERLMTTAIGSAPSDWTIGSAGGTGNVQEFKCSIKSDVRSLKMNDTSSSNIVTADKSFTNLTGANIFEYKVLLPVKMDGTVAQLMSGPTPAVKIVTSGGNLCYVNSTGQNVTIQSYLANLWYHIKIKANQATSTADIYVNEKLKCTGVPFNNMVSNFNKVYFSTPSSATCIIWIDDVKVYQFQPEPGDYVPAPMPAPTHPGIYLGMQDCPLWEEGEHVGWEAIDLYDNAGRKPLNGWYDGGKPEVADWEIKWWVEHGIDFPWYCWYRADDAVGNPIKSGHLDREITDGFMNAKYSNMMKFAITMENSTPIIFVSGLSDWDNNVIPYVMEYFVKDPRYMVIDNKPVIGVAWYDNLIRDLGSKANVQTAVAHLKQACINAGFAGAYVLTRYEGTDPTRLQDLVDVGFDNSYRYSHYSGELQTIKNFSTWQRDAGILKMIPCISMGWQGRDWSLDNSGIGSFLSTGKFEEECQWFKDTFMPSLPTGSLGKKLALFDNWNEHGEGHMIYPNEANGFKYLEKIRSVFSGAGTHTDVIPTENQKSRINILYNKDMADDKSLKAEWKLDDYNLKTVWDTSGNNNTGYFVNQASWAIGKRGSAVSLDGVDDYVSMADRYSLDGMNNLTVSCWINMSQLMSSSVTPVGKDINGYSYRFIVNANGQGGHFAVKTVNNDWYSTGTTASFSTALSANTWYQLVGTYDGQYVRIYLNGALAGTGSAPISGRIWNSLSDLRLGYNDAGAYFKGMIDDVYVYNRALGASEIQDKYNSYGSSWTASTGFSSTQGQNQWYYQQYNGSTYSNMTWDAGNSRWMGAQTYCLIASTWQHPDTNDSVRKWVSPSAGRVTITGNINKSGTSSDGVVVKILKNSNVIWGPFFVNDTTGINHCVEADIAVGDSIYFVVNKYGNNTNDATYWDPTITMINPTSAPPTPTPSPTPVPGGSYTASAGFSSTQGQNQWYYQEYIDSTTRYGGYFTNMTWDSGNSTWKGSTTYCLVGIDGQHPDTNDSARKWVAPKNGTVKIEGNFRLGGTGGDGVLLKIWKNQEIIWNAPDVIGGSSVTSTTDIPFSIEEKVVAGDAIYFVLNKYGTAIADWTVWNPTITYY